jgi:type II secretory pathway pseudopilin PulG
MKPIIKQSNRKAAFTPLERKQGDGLKSHPSFLTGFTIVELLTVMSIIVILIGLLVPSLNMARRYAKKLTQKNQLHVIGIAIEFFNNEWDGYPPSSALDGNGQSYCGALKLCEAMLGQDLLGFHPDSVFNRDGTDNTGRQLYDTTTQGSRKELYLQLESANVYRMEDIYGSDVGSFLPLNYVLCDVYTRELRTGEKTGMPILYYKADTSNKLHDPNSTPTIQNNNGNIYNYWDNQELVALGKPDEGVGATPVPHQLSDIQRFYKNTRNHKIDHPARPYRADSYILISAGFDGEYGTADDVCNYDWKYH